MVFALPAVILFGGLSALLLRLRAVRPLEALVLALFGFFLAATGLGHELAVFFDGLFGVHHGAPVGPMPVVPTTGKGVPL